MAQGLEWAFEIPIRPDHLPESFTPYEPAEVAALRTRPLSPEVVPDRQRLMALLKTISK
jgi:hypothetical protein